MRLLPVIILLFVLQACAPVIKPMGPAAGVPSLTKDALIVTDGAVLPLQS